MSQIRISKFEIGPSNSHPWGVGSQFRNNAQILKIQMTKTVYSFKFNIVWDIGTFVFRICFGFRASDFDFV